MKKLILAGAIIFTIAFGAWWMHDDSEGKPLICEQLSPGVEHSRLCTAQQLYRAREAYSWVIENAPPMPSMAVAGVASFIEDTGRRKNSKFYAMLSRGDLDGACEQMMAYVNRRGEFDPVRAKRRGYERAMCLKRG